MTIDAFIIGLHQRFCFMVQEKVLQKIIKISNIMNSLWDLDIVIKKQRI